MGRPERVVHVGLRGAGYAVDLLVNLQWFVHAAAAAEALVIGTRSGIDLRTLYTALAAGPARSSFLVNEALEVLEGGEYGERFPLGLVAKDLDMAMELARAVGIPAEVSARTHDLYGHMLEHYGAAAGEIAVMRHYEDLAGVSAALRGTRWRLRPRCGSPAPRDGARRGGRRGPPGARAGARRGSRLRDHGPRAGRRRGDRRRGGPPRGRRACTPPSTTA